MKLSKSKLKHIIKEEMQQINEAGVKWTLFDNIHKALSTLAEGLDDVNERLSKLEEKQDEINIGDETY